MTEKPTWQSWIAMITRCTNPRANNYCNYGGRGISICKRWLTFENFLFDMGERPAGTTLDRINCNDNYYPMNCRWATPKVQSLNKRSSILITHNGETMCLSDWAKRIGIQHFGLSLRIKRWGLEQALTRPPRPNYRRKQIV